eukprot:1157951-Pelagomonas_calceolata.AAC.3
MKVAVAVIKTHHVAVDGNHHVAVNRTDYVDVECVPAWQWQSIGLTKVDDKQGGGWCNLSLPVSILSLRASHRTTVQVEESIGR